MVKRTGQDLETDTVGPTVQLEWLNKHADHVSTYFHGLEVSVHAYTVRKADRDSTCLYQQIQLVLLDSTDLSRSWN